MLLHDLALGPGTAAAAHRDAILTSDGGWSRDELRDTVHSMVPPLATLAPRGGRIAVAADGRPEVVGLLLAIPAAGRVAVPLNTRLTPDDLVAQLDAAGVAAIIGTAEELGRLAPVLGQAATVKTSVGLDPGAGDISLAALVAAPAPAAAVAEDAAAPAWVVFTSGTTGRPKGVVLTARSLGAAVATTAAARPFADDDVYLYPFPLYHVSAYNVVHALHRGRPVVLPRRFDPAEITRLAAEHDVTVMSLAPTMLRRLLDHRAQAPDPTAALAGLRTVAYGAAPMAPTLLAEAHAALGVDFAQGYGMTELSGNAVFLSPEDHRRGLDGEEHLLAAAGRPGPGVELRLVAEDGSEVPTGTPGEITVRGEQVCAGYWDEPQATTELIRDGWLHTGDVGVLDGTGLLTVVDRAKDIIVSGGENISSREVEDLVAQHPAVDRVAVVGVPDDRWGEAVCAAVVLRPGTSDDRTNLTAEILALTGAHLAGFKRPKRLVFVDSLPVNASGKVNKPDLRRRLAAGPQPY
ncbi:MAG TPA: AMP-binding protein [Acidimicrobiales bacterium]|nr:AMP-binding protein [Acidimicrobiales bacterium]